MNYQDGINVLPSLNGLIDKSLSKSINWRVIHTALLPKEPNTLLAYIPVLDGRSNGHWLANGVNHEAVYRGSGIYYKQDGSHFDDDLTFYVVLKNRDNPLHVEYKCELLSTLINQEEVLTEDIPSFVLQHL